MREKYFFWIFVKNVSSEGKKPVAGVRETSNFAQTQIMLRLKNTSKETNFSQAPNMVKHGTWNLDIFVEFFSLSNNIWCVSLRLVFDLGKNTLPHFLFGIWDLYLIFYLECGIYVGYCFLWYFYCDSMNSVWGSSLFFLDCPGSDRSV